MVVDPTSTYLQVSAGRYHTCGITIDHTLKCWGSNVYGRLGTGDETQSATPVTINSGVLYSQVSAGRSHTCGITLKSLDAPSKLKCWGYNGSGRLGTGDEVDLYNPTNIDSDTSYIQVSTGGFHTCGVTIDHVLKCWGNNENGQLGFEVTTSRLNPTTADIGISYTQISAGLRHTCGITSSGSLKCWGLNDFGQLGDKTTIEKHSPTTIESGSIFSQISLGINHSCGVTDGGVKCWGSNYASKLGVGGSSSTDPSVIDFGVLYTDISAGYNYTCGVTAENLSPDIASKLKCWGDNYYNQLGNGLTDSISGSPQNSSTPMVIDANASYSHVSTNTLHTCGITSSGSAKCWGYNYYGELGTNLFAPFNPITDSPSSENTIGLDSLTPHYVYPGYAYSQISAGVSHTCAITKIEGQTGGPLKCWGDNSNGERGNGQSDSVTLTKGEPAYEYNLYEAFIPTDIGDSSYYSQVSTGYFDTCGITTGGVLKCWGDNYDGLGTGDADRRLSPTIIDSDTPYSQVSIGRDHICAITTAGTLKCWGGNDYGQLGDGTTDSSLLPTTIDSNVTYSQVSAGGGHTCAITTAGTLKCWGRNSDGQLGDGTTKNSLKPALVNSGALYSKVSAGGAHTCGITKIEGQNGGVLNCWGLGGNGQLGYEQFAKSNKPLLVPLSLGNLLPQSPLL